MKKFGNKKKVRRNADHLQWWQLAQSEVQQETEQVKDRIAVLVASQSILFTALAAVIKQRVDELTLQQYQLLAFLGLLIPPLGIAITTFIMVWIVGAYLDMFRLTSTLQKQQTSQAKDVVFRGFTPMILEMIASLGASLSILVVWIMILTRWSFQTP
jgi:hypothetical protein